MRLAISVDREFDNYGLMCAILDKVDLTELVCLENDLVQRYAKDRGKALQTFRIKWDEISGAKNTKKNKFGKLYNADAPADAAASVVKEATHFVVFGNGDYNINKEAKSTGLALLSFEQEKNESKRYKF